MSKNKETPSKFEKSKSEAESKNSLETNPKAERHTFINNWEKTRIITSSISSIVIPFVIAGVGYFFSQALKEREIQAKFVEIAVNILSQAPDSTKENRSIREWATQIIDLYSGVKLSKETKQNLIENTSIPSSTTPLSLQERCDFNSDGKIDDADLDILKASLGSTVTYSKFDNRADLNNDGKINVIDLTMFLRFYEPKTRRE